MSVLTKKFPDERRFGLIRPGSGGHLFHSTVCERTSRKFVLNNFGAAGQQRTPGTICSEAGGHSENGVLLMLIFVFLRSGGLPKFSMC